MHDYMSLGVAIIVCGIWLTHTQAESFGSAIPLVHPAELTKKRISKCIRM